MLSAIAFKASDKICFCFFSPLNTKYDCDYFLPLLLIYDISSSSSSKNDISSSFCFIRSESSGIKFRYKYFSFLLLLVWLMRPDSELMFSKSNILPFIDTGFWLLSVYCAGISDFLLSWVLRDRVIRSYGLLLLLLLLFSLFIILTFF